MVRYGSFPTISVIVLAAVMCASCSDPQAEKAQYLAKGDQHAAAGRYEEAIIEYRNAIQVDGNFGEARLKLGDAYKETNNYRLAVPEYIRAGDLLPDSRDAQVKAISAFLLAGRFEDAKTRATEMLKKDPKDVEAMLLLANALARLKDAEGAIVEIEEALKVKPDDSDTYLKLGAVQSIKGDSVQAEAAFNQAIKLDPKSAQARLAYAHFLWSARRVAEAEEVLKQTIVLAPKHLIANRMLAALYMVTGRADAAEQPLKTVAEVAKGFEARLLLADFYLGRGRLSDATGVLTPLAAEKASFAAAESRLAQIDYRERRFEQAHQRLDGVLERVPKDVRSLVLKAQWLIADNKLDEALARATAAVAADPQSASAHYVLGAIHDRRREVPAAIAAYSEVLKINPRALDAQVQLARLNLQTGNTASALEFAQGAKQTEPRSVAARVTLAQSLLARNDLKNAAPEIALLLRSFPKESAPHVLNGALQVAQGKLEDGRKSFERALDLAPNNTEAFAGLVDVQLRTKQVAQAVSRAEAQMARQPNDAAVFAVASRAYRAASDPAKAEEVLRRAIAIDPKFLPGYSMLAGLYLRQGRLDDARAEFEGLVKRDPSSVASRTMVGVLLEAQKKMADAQKSYEETVAMSDRAPVAANNLAFMYAESGTKLDQALQLAQSAKAQLPDNPAVDDTLGWVYYKRDLATLAIDSLERSVSQDPSNPIYQFHLGLSYAKAGDHVKARAALEQALRLRPDFDGATEARDALASLQR